MSNSTAMLEFTPLQRELCGATCRKDGTEVARLLLSEAATAFPTVQWSTAHVALLDLYSEQSVLQSEPATSPSKERPEFQSAIQALLGSGLPENLRLHSYRTPSGRAKNPGPLSSTSKRTLSAEYSSPWKSTQRVVFLLESAQPIESEALDRKFSELGIPFFYAALHLFDVIDTATLASWFRFMGRLSPSQLNVMRDIVSSPRHELSSTAERLGISKRGVQTHIYNAMKATEALMPASDRDNGNRSQMVDLFNNFYFLKFSSQVDHHIRKPGTA